jgi:hypothetical protein
MPPHQTSIVTRVRGPNQLIRAVGGREHTVLRVLRPRKKYALLPFTLSSIAYLISQLLVGGSTPHFRTKPVNRRLLKKSVLTWQKPVRSNPDFHYSILEP